MAARDTRITYAHVYLTAQPTEESIEYTLFDTLGVDALGPLPLEWSIFLRKLLNYFQRTFSV